MRASLMPRAPLCFLCERKVPANADSSPPSGSTACSPLRSLLTGWIVSQFFPNAAVDGAALRLKKNAEFPLWNNRGEQQRGFAGTDGLLAFCQEVASTFSVQWTFSGASAAHTSINPNKPRACLHHPHLYLDVIFWKQETEKLGRSES